MSQFRRLAISLCGLRQPTALQSFSVSTGDALCRTLQIVLHFCIISCMRYWLDSYLYSLVRGAFIWKPSEVAVVCTHAEIFCYCWPHSTHAAFRPCRLVCTLCDHVRRRSTSVVNSQRASAYFRLQASRNILRV